MAQRSVYVMAHLRYAESPSLFVDIAAAIGDCGYCCHLYSLLKKVQNESTNTRAADVAMDVTADDVDGVVSAQRQVWTIHPHDAEDPVSVSALVFVHVTLLVCM